MAAPVRTRRLCAWLIALPLMLLGSQIAHALAYRLAYPSLSVRVQVLSATGHGYLAALPLALGILGAIAVCTFGWNAVDAARGRSPRPIPPSAFALLPLLGFTLQELAERWLAVGGLPWWMVEQPTFRLGLVLQLPFAVAAFVATRLLLAGAQRLGRRLARRQPPLAAVQPHVTVRPCTIAAGRPRLSARSTRGPPRLVAC